MAKSQGQKLKLLLLKDYLLRYTDENHPVTVNDMIAHLAQHGISAERKSIYDDIINLQNYGLDIGTVKSKAVGYYIMSRDFELPEIKLLVDAVQSSKFITQSKTLTLIRKIESLASIHEGQSLHRQVVVQNRVKSMNESVYYNVDAISDAISKGVKMCFRYFEYSSDKARHYRRSGEFYTVSPEFMVWDDENYYLVACPDDNDEMRHYRIDKMSDIQLSPQTSKPPKTDPATYTNTLFGMYAGMRRNVRIKFSNSLAGVVIDRFGKNLIFSPHGSEHFTVNVDVSVSPQFMAWIFGLGQGAEILSPEDVRQQMAESLRQVIDMYGASK
ncbi:MAG: WYL domain-containing protein [Clostridiaceae bacterium]|nr:WYL domain-containing protein [Clostridiaceae bacterium]